MTLTIREFLEAHPQTLDEEKVGVIGAGSGEALFVVAGPGTGKTACLALRVLKLVYVDQVDPAGIIATTFTRKAAAELRSRILGWGYTIRGNLLARPDLTESERDWITRADINQMFCGTIDSLCDKLLSEFRSPGDPVFTSVDSYASTTLLTREQFLFNATNRKDAELDELLRTITNSAKFGWNLSAKVKALGTVSERIANDLIDRKELLKSFPRAQRSTMKRVFDIIDANDVEHAKRGYLGYSGMAREVLHRLQQGKLTDFTKKVKAVLVDEYQDTNLLQESLYFEIAKATKGALTVVGDDDQSLYRFRGATVELFSEFPSRFQKVFRGRPGNHFLKTNYRSTKNVVDLVNNYATLDKKFQKVRAKGKPALVGASSVQGATVLGLFRDSKEEVAEDLAAFLNDVFQGRGFKTPSGQTIKKGENGAVGDAALLCSSPREGVEGGFKFPGVLREELGLLTKPIKMFNPRGQDLRANYYVELLMGLALMCIDPSGDIESDIWMPRETKPKFAQAREIAEHFLDDSMSREGRKFVEGWGERKGKWPRRTTLLELIYSLVSFLGGDQMTDPEFVVYLEAITRQLSVLAEIGTYDGQILYQRDSGSPSKGEIASIKEAIRDGIMPILDGSTELDEDLLPTFPRDRLAVLSIHQSKGLEFPLVIVDVGAAFKTNHASQKFKRFPEEHGTPQELEDQFRPASVLGVPTRDALDRTFDDLIRLYFVAFSRPESVLLLVGTKKSGPNGVIQNIATGYDRDGNQHWLGNSFIEEI
jgi:DNA helicase-2/ATP-dependent DNA helicase PcrA